MFSMFRRLAIVVPLIFAFSAPSGAEECSDGPHGQRHAHGKGQGQGKGKLVKTIVALKQLNTTKGYECTASQAKKLLPSLRRLAVTKTLTRDQAQKQDQAIRGLLSKAQTTKLDKLASACGSCNMGQAARGRPDHNPFYVAPGTEPAKGSCAAEALVPLISALQRVK
jgi:hypothetical protein